MFPSGWIDAPADDSLTTEERDTNRPRNATFCNELFNEKVKTPMSESDKYRETP
jgi:hypothetical protein